MLSSLIRFVDSRLGLSDLIRSTMTGKRPPATTSWLHTLGFAALVVFASQLMTGIALAFHYVPSADHAYDSIRILERDAVWGRFVRGLHHWGASAMVVLVFLHGVRVFMHGAYKKPRELTWLLGLGLLAMVLGLGFTGYLLPWDQKAYFATKVGVGIASKAPLAGETMKHVLYGGDEIGPNTLNRFFALHVLVLPGALIVLLALHLQQIQRHGITPVGSDVDDPGTPGKPYHPHHTFKEAMVAAVVISLLCVIAAKFGAPLEAEASAADTAYDPRPDWYFAAPFFLLHELAAVPESIVIFWIPALFGLTLVLLPFVDRNPSRDPKQRRVARTAGVVFVVAVVGLTAAGMANKPGNYLTPPHPLGASPEIREGYDLVRHQDCFSCHTYSPTSGPVYGRNKGDAPDLLDIDMEPDELAEFLLDPESDTMPAYKHLSEEQRLAIGRYIQSLQAK